MHWKMSAKWRQLCLSGVGGGWVIGGVGGGWFWGGGGGGGSLRDQIRIEISNKVSQTLTMRRCNTCATIY